jgi:hypothetical protein
VSDSLRIDNLNNIGDASLNWSAMTTDDPNVTLSPDNDSIAGGGHEFVNVSGTPSGGSFDVNFTSNGGNQTVTYNCTP